MNTIAIDCGASFIKGALIKDGQIIRQLEKSSPKVHGDGSVFELTQINGLVSVVREMITDLGDGEQEVQLCISNEMHGFLLADVDGVPYTDYISWQKEYGSVEIDGVSSLELLKEQSDTLRIENSGMGLRAGLPSCNLLYLVRKGYLDTDRQLFFYTLGDYLIRALSGQEPVCHPTNAAATGLYDIVASDWNKELIQYICADRIIFSLVAMTDRVLQFTMDQMDIYCLPAIGDQQAALLGAGLEKEGELSFNLGTGAQVSSLTSKLCFSQKYQIRPYFKGMYLKTIPHLPSGRAMNVYFRFFKDALHIFGLDVDEQTIWKRLLEAAEMGHQDQLMCDLSFFENPVTDYEMGSVSNIGEYSLTVANLMRAVVDRMIANFLWAADSIEASRDDVRKIIFSGGICRKISLITTGIKDVFGKDVLYATAENETLIGLYQYGLLEGAYGSLE